MPHSNVEFGKTENRRSKHSPSSTAQWQRQVTRFVASGSENVRNLSRRVRGKTANRIMKLSLPFHHDFITLNGPVGLSQDGLGGILHPLVPNGKQRAIAQLHRAWVAKVAADRIL